ncbi:LPXTG cell wall anchor domain-containing protein, partial [Salinicoccus sp. YB14-2]|uniref:LPXTG cell wall anchor domain-containing protein n=1 Tax=Salinicoccus sp. YB14-2 TaxID=1572701 RepID=UPI0018D06788
EQPEQPQEPEQPEQPQEPEQPEQPQEFIQQGEKDTAESQGTGEKDDINSESSVENQDDTLPLTGIPVNNSIIAVISLLLIGVLLFFITRRKQS